MPKLSISEYIKDEMSEWAKSQYPNEGCGVLIGLFSDEGKKAVRFVPLTNDLIGKTIDAPTLPMDRRSGRKEFLMNPGEFNEQTLKAEKEGMDIIGIIHTHPDHPPRPSQIDQSQPFLSQWSNVILGVAKGAKVEIKSWFRDDDSMPLKEEVLSA